MTHQNRNSGLKLRIAILSGFILVLLLLVPPISPMLPDAAGQVSPDGITLNNTDGGDCSTVGTWDAASKTCTLTSDINATSDGVGIYISSSWQNDPTETGIILDGNGHTVTGAGTNGIDNDGVRITGQSSNITVKDLNITNFKNGINSNFTNGLTITGVTVNNIGSYGIYLYGTDSLTLQNNTVAGSIVIYEHNAYIGHGNDSCAGTGQYVAPSITENGPIVLKNNVVTSGQITATPTGICYVGNTVNGAEFPEAAPDPTAPFTILDDSTGGECEYIGIWNSGTKTCTLTQDISSDSTGIIFGNHGITLDGNNYSISGSGSDVGVATGETGGFTIENLTIYGFNNGIQSSNIPTWGVIQDNTIRNNSQDGIYNQGSAGIANAYGPLQITDNEIKDNGRNGITISWSKGDGSCSGNGAYLIKENTITSNTDNGIEAFGGDGIPGVSSLNSQGLCFDENTVNDNGNGFYVVGNSNVDNKNNIFTDNVANSNTNYGYYFEESSSEQVFTGNTATGNGLGDIEGLNLPDTTPPVVNIHFNTYNPDVSTTVPSTQTFTITNSQMETVPVASGDLTGFPYMFYVKVLEEPGTVSSEGDLSCTTTSALVNERWDGVNLNPSMRHWGGDAGEIDGDMHDGLKVVAIMTPQGSDLLFPVGSTTVTCTATDVAGNVGTASFTINVVLEEAADTTPPTVNVPNDLTFVASDCWDSGCQVPILSLSDYQTSGGTFPPTATDDVDGSMVPSCWSDTNGNYWQFENDVWFTDVDGSLNFGLWTIPGQSARASLQAGVHTFTCSATDVAGNTGSASFTITVVEQAAADTTPPADPTITVPSDITQTTTDPAGAEVSFSVTATSVGPPIPASTPLISSNSWLVQDHNPQCYLFNESSLQEIHALIPDSGFVNWGFTSDFVQAQIGPNGSPPGNNLGGSSGGNDTVRTFESSWVFPVGTTTVFCYALDDTHSGTWEGFSDGFKHFNSPRGPSLKTGGAVFDVTVVLEEAVDTSAFNTVQTFDSGGHHGMQACIGYENPPAGTGHVRLLGPQQGNSASYYEDYQWLSGGLVGNGSGGTTCTNHQLAGEYKFAAFPGPLTSNVNIGSLIEFATPIIVEEWQHAPPTVIPPADITQTTTDPAGAIVTFSATAVQGTLPIHPDYPVCSLPPIFSSGAGFSGIEASGTLFPVGTTTVLCMAFDTQMGSVSDSEIVSFEVTVVLEEAADDTPPSSGFSNFDTITITSVVNPSDTCIAYTGTSFSGNWWDSNFGITEWEYSRLVINDAAPYPGASSLNEYPFGFRNHGDSLGYDFDVTENIDDEGQLLPGALNCVAMLPITWDWGTDTRPLYYWIEAHDSSYNIIARSTPIFLEQVSQSDTTPPTITANNITQSATNSVGAAISYNITTSDNSGVTPSLTCTPQSGSFFQIGTTPVTCTATDAAGNSTSASFNVTLNYTAMADTQSPVLSMPNNVSKTISMGQGTIVTYSLPTATDNYGVVSGPTCTPQSGTIFPVGNTNVTCTASDAAGNTVTDTFTVTVVKQGPGDVTPPTFQTVSSDIEVDAITSNGSTVGYQIPSVTDDVGVTSGPTCTPESGSFFKIGKTTVTCTATDAVGNQGSTAFIVNVKSQIAVPETIQTSVSINSGKASYYSDEIITATGTVSPVTGDQITFKITDSANKVIAIEQKSPSSIGTYNVSFTPNMLWNDSGTYEINAQYGTSEEKTVFYFEVLEEQVEQPIETANNPTNLDLFLTDLQGSSVGVTHRPIEIGETIKITAKLYSSHLGTVDPKSDEIVFLSIEGETGQVLLQSLTTDFGGNVSLNFTLQESLAPGVYTVSARSLGNGWEMNTPLHFTATKPVAQVSVSEVLSTTDQGEKVSTYDAGNLAYFKTNLTSSTDTPVLVTINVFDAQNNTLGVGFFKSTIGAGNSEIVLGFELPKDTASGVASVYTNVFTDWPDRGGVLITDEVKATVNIIGVESTPESVPQTLEPDVNVTIDSGDTSVASDIIPEPIPEPELEVIIDSGDTSVTSDIIPEPVIEPEGPDTTPPVITTPSDIIDTLNEETSRTKIVTWNTPTAVDNIDGALANDAINCSSLSGSSFPIGITKVVCSTTDSSGNVGTSSFDILINSIISPLDEIVDVTPPTFFPEPESIHIQTSNPIGSIVYYTKPLPIDDSYIIDDTKCTPPSGTLFPYGNTIVVCTATDAAGNVGNSTFTVTVSDSPADTIPPTIITPSYLLYKINDADAKEVVLGAAPQWQKTHQMVYEVTVLDNSEDVIKPKCTPPSGTFFPVGITPVTCTATDSSGNTASASFDVTVLAYNDISDKSPPTISATSDIIKYVSQTTGTPVTYSIPTAYDDSGLDGSVLCMPMSGTLFIIGTTTVTCTVSDNVGNTATSSFDVTILVLDIDLASPTFSETEDITKLAINPSGIAVQYFTPTAFDQSPLDGSVTCTPSSGTLFPVGKTIVTCSVIDMAGNIGTTAFTVIVTLYNEGGN